MTLITMRRSFVPRRSIRLAGGGVLIFAAFAMTGCGGITADGVAAAQVRFVDTSGDAPAMDLYLDGSGAAYGLSFGTVTSYIPVSPGEVKLSAHRANTAQALVSAKTELAGTRQYTAVVSNMLGGLEETVYPDANGPAPAGNLAVRVLNEDAASGPLDVYLVQTASALSGAAPVVRELGYTASSGYVDVPAANYVVAVVSAGVLPNAANAVLHGISVNGGSGAVRTLVLSGAPLGGGKGVTGFVLEDADTP